MSLVNILFFLPLDVENSYSLNKAKGIETTRTIMSATKDLFSVPATSTSKSNSSYLTFKGFT